MTQELHDILPAPHEIVAIGEPTHQEPAFGFARNELFASLARRGFRSIALETDRVAALAVDDYVQGGAASIDTVLAEGFSHGFGQQLPNRRLIAWMREFNAGRAADERLTFHGMDAPFENTSAPSPRPYLDYGCRYLGIDLDLTELLGPDERWSRAEAILDPGMSVGDTAAAATLRAIADDLLTTLYARTPDLIASTSRAAWLRARTHLTAALGVLRYHKQAAQPLEASVRISRLLATRDALMAQNLLDIRDIERERGATLVFAHNSHVQRGISTMSMAGMQLDWFSAGAIVGSLLEGRYAVVVGSLGRSAALGLGDPAPQTFESALHPGIGTWGLLPATATATDTGMRQRTDTRPEQGYFPLDQPMIEQADAILHVNADGTGEA